MGWLNCSGIRISYLGFLYYLQQAGVIVKIESCSKFVKKNSFPHEGLTLFMICSNCGTIIQHTDSKIQYYVEDK
ncbi:hypothetical protein PT211_25800, partial [Klebsiella pneumoniae]|nr:hypothetical protein [Klebsiella pneumoniae]